VHAPANQGGVDSVANQASFEAILDSSSNFTDHGVIALQHDIYVEAVNLAIGYTLPYLLNHTPPFTLKPILQCQGRPDQDAYIETNTNPDSPAVSGHGDVATRTSNLGYAALHHDNVSVPPSRTYDTTMATFSGTLSGTGSHIVTSTAGSGSGSGSSTSAASRITSSSFPLAYLGFSLFTSVILGGLIVL
jgi:hypothetical protein